MILFLNYEQMKINFFFFFFFTFSIEGLRRCHQTGSKEWRIKSWCIQNKTNFTRWWLVGLMVYTVYVCI